MTVSAVIAVAATVLTLAAGEEASGGAAASVSHIYWTNAATSRGPEGSGIDTVARADLNGGNINPDLVKIGEFPEAIAVDAKHIYWVNAEHGAIGRADLDGSHVNYEFIRATGNALLVHGNYIYWLQATRIGRARIDGTNVNPNFVNIKPLMPFFEVFGLAADGKHLYWSDQESGGAIGRVDLNGKNVRKRFVTNLGATGSLAADGKHLYWANGRWGTINRTDLNGRHRIRRFVVGPPAGTHIAVGAQHIYWTDGASIGSASISGTEVNSSFIHAGAENETGSSVPAGLTVGP
ncbi:MAG: hypothetical protein ACTHM1_04915 [Solirubrobacteraceae bacterium]